MELTQDQLKKQEILFLWDVENSNPNGDILSGNEPRRDSKTGIAEITDVRIKRTIRDEIIKSKPESIFVKEYRDSDNNVLQAKEVVEFFKINMKQPVDQIKADILNSFIDIRSFGAVIPLEKKVNNKKGKGQKNKEEPTEDDEGTESQAEKINGINFTGPVQFRMSKSLHKVEVEEIQGTGAFASGKDKGAKTLRTEYILKYAMLGTYGIIDNYNAMKTGFNKKDAEEILRALWNGTKNLITRSKMGQMPRFMLVITYKDDTFIGDLNNSVRLDRLDSVKDDREIRSLNDFKVDFSLLKQKISKYADKIEKIEYVSDFDFDAVNKSSYDASWVKKEF